MDGDGSSSEDYEPQQEDISPTVEVVYPLNEETEVPNTRGQLFKTVLVEGTGPKPPKGAKVSVHYVGTLASDGSKFDSSRDRDEYFDFTIGQGQVIKGWDQGVATMRKGEKAMLRCLPEYAYGASGSPPKIPPNSTLNFEVELFDWTKSEDVSTKKDKSVMKNIISEGKDWERPSYETVCVVNATHFDGESDVVLSQKTEWGLVMGEADIPMSLTVAIESMKKGEVADIEIKSLESAFPELPSLSGFVGKPVRVRIELTDFTPVKTWSFKGHDKVVEGKKRKDAGNEYFKAKLFEKAIAKYKRGLEFVEHEYGLDDETDKAEAKALKISMWSNTAQCQLSLGRYAECISYCNKVLEVEPKNTKALFRRGKSEGLRQNWDEGIKDLKKVLELDPSNADAAHELAVVQDALRRHNSAQKARYGNMFAKMSAMEEAEKKAVIPPTDNKAAQPSAE